MPKIPELSVGIQMERSVSVSSDRNIRDHLWRWSTYFGRNILTEICHSIFDKLVLIALIREFGRETNSGKSHYYWLARFNRKMSFHFAQKFPLISDRSVWHNGKHPLSPGAITLLLDFSSPELFPCPFRLFPAPTNCPWLVERP